MKYLHTANALVWVQQVHEHIFGTSPFPLADFEAFSTTIGPADFEAQSSLLWNRMHLQIQIPNVYPEVQALLLRPNI